MDITRFHAAFFEESRENLDAMEAGLLAMESGSADGETINVVFRAAHSIKGGAATFGFTSISELTHQLETLLDEARSGRRQLDADAIGALLVSGDALSARCWSPAMRCAACSRPPNTAMRSTKRA